MSLFDITISIQGYPNNAFVEFGRKNTQNDMAYIHPSVDFGSHKTYNHGIEVGMLILFCFFFTKRNFY